MNISQKLTESQIENLAISPLEKGYQYFMIQKLLRILKFANQKSRGFASENLLVKNLKNHLPKNS